LLAMTGGSGPHDAVFRRVLEVPENAASQLRAVLPAGLVGRLDLDRLTRIPGSLVDPTLRWRHTDLLFSVPLDGRKAFIYVLVEHQSSTDKLMPFRMLHYMVRIWDQWLARRPEETRLPAVIPLVVHHNRRAWTGPTDVIELIDLDSEAAEAVREFLPRLRFLLDDLAVVDEQRLRARPLTPPVRVMLLLLKVAAGNKRLVEDLRRWDADLKAVVERPNGVDDLIALLSYIEKVGEAPAEELHELFAQLGPKAEEAYVTTAEMLRAEGELRGVARGRAESLVQLLHLKFGPLPPAALDLVHAASVDQLETWTDRVLTADTLDEVLH
jgi:hypothetical protein